MSSRARAGLPTEEERLLEYATRLDRHRDGRIAIWVDAPLRLAGRARREATAFASNALAPLTQESRGQMFMLATGEVVVAAIAPREAHISRILLDIDFALTERDPLGRPIEGAPNHRLYRLEADYDAFRERVEIAARAEPAAPDAEPAEATRPLDLPIASEMPSPSNLRSVADAARTRTQRQADALLEGAPALARVAGKREAIDLDTAEIIYADGQLLPPRRIIEIAQHKARLQRIASAAVIAEGTADGGLVRKALGVRIEADKIGPAFGLTHAIASNPRYLDNVVEQAEADLLRHAADIMHHAQLAQNIQGLVLRVGLATLMRAELLELDRQLSHGTRARVTFLVPYADRARAPRLYAYMGRFLGERGISLGLDAVPLITLARAAVSPEEAAMVAVVVSRRGIRHLDNGHIKAIRDSLQAFGPSRVLATGIGSSEMLELARLLGAGRFAGRYISRSLIERDMAGKGAPDAIAAAADVTTEALVTAS